MNERLYSLVIAFSKSVSVRRGGGVIIDPFDCIWNLFSARRGVAFFTLCANRNLVYLFSLILLLQASQPSQALDPNQLLTQYSIKTWRSDQGLPADSVISLAQTPDGYLWCGTEHGLARFDGVSFTVFNRSNTPALTNNSIHALLTDRLGRLWIGTGGGGLVLLDGKIFIHLSTRDGLICDTILSLAEDQAGAIWIGTSSGLSRYTKGRFANFTDPRWLPSLYCRSLSADKMGRLWIGTAKGLSCFSEGHFTKYMSQENLTHVIVRVVKSGRDGSLWLGVGDEMLRWQDGKITKYGSTEALPHGNLSAMSEDRDGNLWVAMDGGVSRWREGQCTGLFTAPLNLTGTAHAILEDSLGNVWVGTSDGLIRIGNNRCVPTSVAEGLIAEKVNCVYADRKGNLWAGTSGGLSVRRNNKWTSYTTTDGLPGNNIRSITEDHSGNIWIGTLTGLTRFREGQFEIYTKAHGLTDNSIIALYPDRKGTLWIGTGGGGICCYREGKFGTIPSPGDLNGAICRTFYEDSTGALWIGTNGAGVYVVRDDTIQQYTTKNGLSVDLVLAIYQTADGAMWISTHGGGLTRFQNNRWSHFNTSNGLSDDIIYLIFDVGSHLWLSTTKGISRVRKSELVDSNSTIHPLVLGKNDGMRILDCNGGTQQAGCQTQDGLLWFPTDRGLISVNPEKVETNITPPTIMIVRVEADGTTLTVDGPIVVAPGRGELEFHYAAVDLSNPESVRFRYKLEGFDADWVEAGGRRAAYYTNLPPNQYQFRVMACNGEGVWQETPAFLELTLRPHFYQTGWFYGLCIFACVATAFAVHIYRTRHLRSREEELARCVADRTRQLQNEVAQHARTGELLRQSQKLEAVGQLAGGVAHDFNNLLTVINGYAELLLESPTRESMEREMLQDMLSAGNRAAALTRQLLAFSSRQVLLPKVLDPNFVVLELQRLIGRLIGENITLTTTLDPNVSHVKVDPVQLQQVLINLCVNARDAMPRGGSIQIVSRNVVLGPETGRELPDAIPGTYVNLEVTDNGFGMPESVRTRVFEPFFTTKGPGKGTGLGLATVYGILRQSGGHVTVSSEVGVGTTFQIYLPCAEGESVQGLPQKSPGTAPRGIETILLVEDESSVLAVARHLLLSCGYRVLEAQDGLAALRLALSHEGPIDLLVTDVVMPQLSGRELAEELKNHRPSLRVLFVSGYTDDVILRHGVSDAEFAFLQKPYSPAELAFKVRAVLDGKVSTFQSNPEVIDSNLGTDLSDLDR